MNRSFNKNNNFRGKRDLHRINNFISATEVRVILDDGEQLGVMTKNEAIDIAKGRGLDLVEIAPNNKPCLLYTSPSPRDQRGSRMPSSA